MVHALLDTTQVISTIKIDGATHEVCAEAVATHDRRTNQLTISLRSYLRATQHDHMGETTTPAWLPAPQTVTEHVAVAEAHEMANEVFASWGHKVKGMIPA